VKLASSMKHDALAKGTFAKYDVKRVIHGYLD